MMSLMDGLRLTDITVTVRNQVLVRIGFCDNSMRVLKRFIKTQVNEARNGKREVLGQAEAASMFGPHPALDQ